MILAAGTSARMLRSASRPSITGIERSSRTTSGRSEAHRLDPGQAVAGLADDLHAAADQGQPEQLAQVGGVVDDDDPQRRVRAAVAFTGVPLHVDRLGRSRVGGATHGGGHAADQVEGVVLAAEQVGDDPAGRRRSRRSAPLAPGRLVEVERHLRDDQALQHGVVELERLLLALARGPGRAGRRASARSSCGAGSSSRRRTSAPITSQIASGQPQAVRIASPCGSAKPSEGSSMCSACAPWCTEQVKKIAAGGGAERVGAQLVAPRQRHEDREGDQQVGEHDHRVADQADLPGPHLSDPSSRCHALAPIRESATRSEHRAADVRRQAGCQGAPVRPGGAGRVVVRLQQRRRSSTTTTAPRPRSPGPRGRRPPVWAAARRQAERPGDGHRAITAMLPIAAATRSGRERVTAAHRPEDLGQGGAGEEERRTAPAHGSAPARPLRARPRLLPS